MAAIRTYEKITHSSVYTVGAVDLFAVAWTSKPSNNLSSLSIVPPILGELRFFLTKQLAPSDVDYKPPRAFITWANRSGFLLFSGEFRAPDRPGTLTLAPGRYRWRVESDYYQLATFDAQWPPTDAYVTDLKLLPGPTYPFPDLTLKQRDLILTLLRGTLFSPGDKPLDNTPVELIAPQPSAVFADFTKCLTNTRGEWVLAFIEKRERNLALVPPVDYAKAKIQIGQPPNSYIVELSLQPGVENSLRQTALRGRVARSDGMPIAGAKITTSVGAGQATSQADGQWFFYFDLRQKESPVDVTAVTPDGRTGNQQSVIKPQKTVVVPTIEIS